MRAYAPIMLALALAACGASEPEVIQEAVTPATPSSAAPADPLDDDPSRGGRTHVSFSFDELDLNDDGSIAKTESAFDAWISEMFGTYDTDDDDKLTRFEFEVARARQQSARK
jgi:hypothetical protein